MACTLPPLVRKGRALKFAHIATEIVMSELTFACGLCGNTNEPSYVSTSFGESCLFLLSGSKRKVKTLESVCPEIGCATTKSGTGLVPSDALVLALEIIGREVCKFRATSYPYLQQVSKVKSLWPIE